MHHIPELIIRGEDRGKVWRKMSRSEDYLDQLLKGIEPEDSEAIAEEPEVLEEDIFSDILEELAEGEIPAEDNTVEEPEEEALDGEMPEEDSDMEDDIFDEDFLDEEFLREFELEMEKLEDSEETGDEDDVLSLFDDLDSILKGGIEPEAVVFTEEPVVDISTEPEFEIPMEQESEVSAEPEIMPGMNFADLFAEESQTESSVAQEGATEDTPAEGGFSFANLFASDEPESEADTPQEDADVLKILEGLEGIDLELDEEDDSQAEGGMADFSALEGFLAASTAEESSESNDAISDNLDEYADVSAVKADKSAPQKSGEKNGFMQKLGLILFGEDDEDDEPVQGKSGSIIIGEADASELDALEDITEKSKKEQKKKEKKEKREQAKLARKEKQEKAKLEKAKKAKPKKEKPPKKPKVPDNTPPLPKKPVFLIFLMVASLLALILMGADLLGYANQMENAKNQYAKKNYSAAFAEISGMEVEEEDMAVYEKYQVMATVSAELEAYESLMNHEFYEMALDCLVRTIGRAEKYQADAERYGCAKELNELEAEAETVLKDTFDLSREEALEFYGLRSKKEYSVALKKVIKELGLEKVTE